MKFNSYKELGNCYVVIDKNKFKNENYLDNLSSNIIVTFTKMKKLNESYESIHKFKKEICNGKKWQIINKEKIDTFFNEIKQLYIIQFYNQIRDYFRVVRRIIVEKNNNENKIKEKYKDVNNYINNTKFISSFFDLRDKTKFSGISLVLHNMNKHDYYNNYDISYEILKEIGNKIANTNIDDVKKEFKDIILMFRQIDNCKSVIEPLENIYFPMPIKCFIDAIISEIRFQLIKHHLMQQKKSN